MALKRCLMEIGTGVDLSGRDYTKACRRAVKDAIGSNGLSFVRSVGAGPESMYVEVTVGVARPNEVDADQVLDALPYGHKSINVVQGGLDMPSYDGSDAIVIANAALIVSLDLETESPN